MRAWHVFAIGTAIVSGLFNSAEAQVPERINYQGRLVRGSNLVNGSVQIVFRMYDADTGGIVQYAETQTVAAVDGLYSTTIGGETGLADVLTNDRLYLEVEVDGTTLSPREQLVSVPFALMAGAVTNGAITGRMLADYAVTSNKLAAHAVTAGALVDGAVTSRTIAPTSVSSAHIADGAVGDAQLARRYQSGTMAYLDLMPSHDPHFQDILTNAPVSFVTSFSTTPMITLGVESPYTEPGELPYPVLSEKSPSGFNALVSVPSKELIIGPEHRGWIGSLAVVNGHPAIAYYDVDASGLRYVRALDSNGLAWGEALMVDTNSLVGQEPSLAVVNGRPAISYRHAMFASLYYVRATDVNGTDWAAPVLVQQGNPSNQCIQASLAVVHGNPAISYYELSGGNLKYVRATDVDGTHWGAPMIVDAGGDTGQNSSLGFYNNYPVISYHATAGHLMFAEGMDHVGSFWTIHSIDTSGSGLFNSLALVGGRPAIAYYRDYGYNGGALMYVIADNGYGTTWGDPVMIASCLSSGCDVGAHASLAVVGGLPAIACYEMSAGDIRYYRADDVYGSNWTVRVDADTRNDVGENLDMAVVNGRPALTYRDRTIERLKYLRSGNPPPEAFVNWIAVEP